jgi:hypothetical protein
MGSAHGWVPSACALPSVEQPLRLAEFDRLFRTTVHQATRTRPTNLELVLSPECEAFARDLASRETSCCSFFQFAFALSTGGLVMDIGVPDDHVDVLDALQSWNASTTEIGNENV